MLPHQVSAYASSFQIVDTSTPPLWLSLSNTETICLFNQYLERVRASMLLSDMRLEGGLLIDDASDSDIFVSLSESALFKQILLSSVEILDD